MLTATGTRSDCLPVWKAAKFTRKRNKILVVILSYNNFNTSERSLTSTDSHMIAPIKTGIKKFFAALALLSVELLVAIAIFLLSLIAFIQVARMVFLQNKEAIDLRAFDFLSGFVNDFNSEVMQFFTFLGTHHFLIPANFVLIGYFLFIRVNSLVWVVNK